MFQKYKPDISKVIIKHNFCKKDKKMVLKFFFIEMNWTLQHFLNLLKLSFELIWRNLYFKRNKKLLTCSSACFTVSAFAFCFSGFQFNCEWRCNVNIYLTKCNVWKRTPSEKPQLVFRIYKFILIKFFKALNPATFLHKNVLS